MSAYRDGKNMNYSQNFRRKLRSPEKQVSTGISARSSSLASLMNQSSPSRDEEDVMRSARRIKSPEKSSNPGRSSSLAALMDNLPTKEDETTESEDTGDQDSSDDTESR